MLPFTLQIKTCLEKNCNCKLNLTNPTYLEQGNELNLPPT